MEIEIECSKTDIPEDNYSNCIITESNIKYNNMKFEDFFKNFMIRNRPCLIRNVTSDWQCAKKWVENDHINYNYIKSAYGDLEAPVADCNALKYNSHCKNDMNVSDYMEYLKDPKCNKLLYLKDWHLRQYKPEDNFYKTPQNFALDWLNEYAVDNEQDDFMFVYIGPEGSWTPLHEDVYCSYSWSVNVVGRKKWILFPPGEQNKFKDTLGNLPLMFEPEKYKNIKYFEIIQEKGDALFVPSGWHHQVINEMHTISVNHNWINACNIHIVWKALQNSLLMVEHQIREFKDTPEFPSQCQLILKSVFGMDFKDFLTLLFYISKKRLKQLQGDSKLGLDKYSLGINIIKFELKHILKVMDSINTHPILISKNLLPSIQDDFTEIKDNISQILN
ncbi:unnamed protein product [Arctia plantaginis]|uniref:Jumonji domain-containing protein 4 n=1 Tax=Arctia plantaginis TaxID=874455 RepID=A0A8S1AL17_ARCPL|nr:unnamed protein product [Arctia plantaginis]